ncbi:MAG: hypothetical protein WD749_01275 [Phycisphaerales bacterium]
MTTITTAATGPVDPLDACVGPRSAARERTIRVHEQRAGDEELVDFDLTGLIVAGLAGIMAIMAVLYGAPAVGLPRVDVIGLAGTLFTDEPMPALITGSLLWVSVGMLWAVVYVGLWARGIGRATVGSGLLLGLVHGAVVMAAFPAFLALHPDTREMQAPLSAGIALVLAHLVFGAVVAGVYRVYVEEEGT